MANKKDDATHRAANLEQAARIVERAQRAIMAVTGKSPDKLIISNRSLSDGAVNRLFDEAEKQYAAHEAGREAAVARVAEIESLIEESLARKRRRDTAIEKLLAIEDARRSTASDPASMPRRAKIVRGSPEMDRILADVPRCGASWSMGNKKIAALLREYWKARGQKVAVDDGALIQRIKRAKDQVRKKGSSGT
jgi:hypothetical protein